MFTLRWQLAQFLERRWWKRYLATQLPDEYLTEKRRYWQRVMKTLELEDITEERVLDAGCGPAGIFIHLPESARITAVDPLLDRYAEDLAIFRPEDYPRVAFRCSPLETVSLPEASFEVIFCLNAINHVADRELVLNRLGQWMKPGGILVLTSDVHRFSLLRSVFRALPGDALHPHQHSAAEYRNDLTRLGWTIDREVLLKPGKIFDYLGWVMHRTK